MHRTIKAILAVIFIAIIMGSAISICQNIGRSIRADITDQKLYTLSDGSKAILAKLQQPIKMKLYYTKTAALKGPDHIRYFNNYYTFVRDLLDEYATQAGGKVDFEIVDPRPFSNDEEEALRHGLKRFPITKEENFFFGLVVQTEFGVTKSIPFFAPDRQNFVEYDISSIIDRAITREKKQIGVLSSLPVMGDDVSGYMAQMMQMQGKQPKPSWFFVEQLKQSHNVTKIEPDTDKIEGIDLLMVIHPKDLPQKTLFAIDQFVLNGGRTIVCVDPHSILDQPDPQARMQGMPHASNSDLNILLNAWGLDMPKDNFAGDRDLALEASLNPNQRPEKIIGFLEMKRPCMNRDNVITAELNQVRMLFSGVLKEIDLPDAETQIERVPLIQTTDRGNTWQVSSPYELMMPNAQSMMKKFKDGTEPVALAYRVTGKLPSAFPNGIDIEVQDQKDATDGEEKTETTKTEHITGLTVAEQDCAVVVIADVDFISDFIAYQKNMFGASVVGDNSALILNSIEDLSGSTDLISIRSRGNFKRPFTVVEKIEAQAEQDTADEIATLQTQISSLQQEINKVVASAENTQQAIIKSSELVDKRNLELKRHQAERKLREVQMAKIAEIENLGNKLRNINMLSAPAIILIVAVILAIYRSTKRRRSITHESDA